jgi:hypothetical protein
MLGFIYYVLWETRSHFPEYILVKLYQDIYRLKKVVLK